MTEIDVDWRLTLFILIFLPIAVSFFICCTCSKIDDSDKTVDSVKKDDGDDGDDDDDPNALLKEAHQFCNKVPPRKSSTKKRR